MMECYSAIKKNEIMPFVATWMDLKSVILSEVNQTEKEKYRDIPMNLLTKPKETWRQENKPIVTGVGEGWGWAILREFGMDMYTLF